MNYLSNYYLNQAGGKLARFHGLRNQKGFNIFSKIFSKSLIPLLQMIGSTIKSEQLAPVRNLVKEGLKEAGVVISKEALKQVTDMIKPKQSGSGKRKRISHSIGRGKKRKVKSRKSSRKNNQNSAQKSKIKRRSNHSSSKSRKVKKQSVLKKSRRLPKSDKFFSSYF